MFASVVTLALNVADLLMAGEFGTAMFDAAQDVPCPVPAVDQAIDDGAGYSDTSEPGSPIRRT